MLARPGGGGAGGLNASVGGVIARGASSEGGASWSPESIARLVTLLPDALVFEPGLREQWADEARRWLLRAASFPLASASARVLAALRAPLDPDAADALLAALCSSAAAAEGGTVARGLEFGRRYPGQHGRWRPPSAGFGGVSARSAAAAADLAGLLLDTLSEMFSLVRREADAIRYPQVFWGAAACLRTLHPPLYARAARLVSVMALAWPLDDPTGAAETILAVSAPVAVGDEYPKAARRIAADAADAAVDAWCANVKPGGFARRWSPPPGVPDPAASLADLVPLLLKGVARRDAAPHAARALAALAGAAGAGGAAWGGERALALLLAGLLPVVIAAAAAAEEEAAREAEDPRGLAGGGVGGVGMVGGVGGVGGVGAGGFATGASPGTPGSASTPNPADAPDFSATTTPGRTPTGTPDGTSAFDFGSGRYAHASPRASPTSGASPAVADAARRRLRASPRAGPLGVAEARRRVGGSPRGLRGGARRRERHPRGVVRITPTVATRAGRRAARAEVRRASAPATASSAAAASASPAAAPRTANSPTSSRIRFAVRLPRPRRAVRAGFGGHRRVRVRVRVRVAWRVRRRGGGRTRGGERRDGGGGVGGVDAIGDASGSRRRRRVTSRGGRRRRAVHLRAHRVAPRRRALVRRVGIAPTRRGFACGGRGGRTPDAVEVDRRPPQRAVWVAEPRGIRSTPTEEEPWISCTG